MSIKKVILKNVLCVSQSVIEPPDFVCFQKTRKQKKRVNLLNISPNIANKKQKFPIKVYVFELADLSATQWCKNQIHTMLVSKAYFFHLRFSLLLIHFLKTKTIAEYCAFEYLSNGTKFITIEEFLEKL